MILVPEATFRVGSDTKPDDQPPGTTPSGDPRAGMNGGSVLLAGVTIAGGGLSQSRRIGRRYNCPRGLLLFSSGDRPGARNQATDQRRLGK